MNIGECIDGRHIIKERIGGGFGTVWRALDRERDEVVAVKELGHKWLNSPKMLNYFKNEFKLLERLGPVRLRKCRELITKTRKYVMFSRRTPQNTK